MTHTSALAKSLALVALLAAGPIASGTFPGDAHAQTTTPTDPLLQDNGSSQSQGSDIDQGRIGNQREFSSETPSLQDRLRNPGVRVPGGSDNLLPFEPGVGSDSTGTIGGSSTGGGASSGSSGSSGAAGSGG